MYDDPNRESLGLPPIWTGAGAEPDPEPDVEPGAHTVEAVKSWVDRHDDRADEVLAAERARGSSSRSSLVTWLEGFIASRDDDPD